MKIGLFNREQIRQLGGGLLDELDSLITRIRASWSVEHGPDGEHTTVHAQTVSSGRLTFSDIVTETISTAQVDNLTPGGIETAAILRLASSSQTPVVITGLHVPQDGDRVLDGRVLVIENVSRTTTFVLESESTHSVPRNRFRTPGHVNPNDTSAPARVYLLPTSLTLLTYNATLARWIVHSQRTDDTDRIVSLSASTHNDLSVGNLLAAKTLRVAFSGSGGALSGIVSTGIPETTRLSVANVGLYAFDILHRNTGSQADNRIACPGGVRYRVNPREACELVRTVDGWRIAEKAAQWIDVPYNAGNFTASAGTWTVSAGDVVTLAYQLDGNRMTVAFELTGTSLSSSATSLRIAIPGGRVAARQMRNAMGRVADNGTILDTGYAFVQAGGTVIELRKNASSSAWSASSNNLDVAGQITFMVRDDCASISEAHTDQPHGDTPHQDGDHSDVPHSDSPHGDSHTDDPHEDVAHKDSSSHTDTPHDDVAHQDSTVSHVDHNDGPGHGDVPASHFDAPHDDVPHGDQSGHTDTPHTDEAHEDTHNDSPFRDTEHADSGHGDTPHDDSPHEDVGYHCDVDHADV